MAIHSVISTAKTYDIGEDGEFDSLIQSNLAIFGRRINSTTHRVSSPILSSLSQAQSYLLRHA